METPTRKRGLAQAPRAVRQRVGRQGGTTQTENTKRRGFGSLTPEQRRENSRKGGKLAHQLGKAHEWTSEEAQEAGRKGGLQGRGGRPAKERGEQ